MGRAAPRTPRILGTAAEPSALPFACGIESAKRGITVDEAEKLRNDHPRRRMTRRSCFAGLARAFEEHLANDSETRQLADYHRARIESVFDSQPDLPLHQDTVAGFLQGFMITIAYYVPNDSVEQQSVFPVLGGTLLLGQDLPIDTSPAAITAGRSFIERAVVVLEDARCTRVAYDLVQHGFDLVPDVPMSCASLGGFCLGVLYASPYLTCAAADQTALMSAACKHARELPQRP